MIDIEALKKYGMAFEDDKTFEDSLAHYENEEHFYRTFLMVTDHIPLKIVESLIETMNDATALDFMVRFLAWIVKTHHEYSDIISYRKEARKYIPKEEL